MINDADPCFTQMQVAECTSADARTIENYVNYGYVRPAVIDGRRRFTLRQLIKVEFIFRLASACKIAPKTGSKLAERILMQDRFGLGEDLKCRNDSQAWAHRSRERLDLILDANSGDEVKFAPDAAARIDSIHLSFPARHFSRLVIQNAAPLMMSDEMEFTG
jgi:hypothetical protein